MSGSGPTLTQEQRRASGAKLVRSFSLSEETSEAIDEIAAERRCSRSEAVAQAVAVYLAQTAPCDAIEAAARLADEAETKHLGGPYYGLPARIRAIIGK